MFFGFLVCMVCDRLELVNGHLTASWSSMCEREKFWWGKAKEEGSGIW